VTIDPRWNNLYPFWKEHTELNLRGDWDTFFALVSRRLERFVLYDESGISNPTYLGDCLITDSLGYFVFDRTHALHLELKSFFSIAEVHKKVEEELERDRGVQAARASLISLRRKLSAKNVGADALVSWRRQKTKEEIQAEHALAQIREQRAPSCRATVFIVKLSVLQAFFKLILKSSANLNAFQSLRADVQSFFVSAQISYDIASDGTIIRYGQEPLSAVLIASIFRTGDSELDGLLNTARQKYLDRDTRIHRESIEKLWDAWERLKTIEPGKDKKDKVTALLSRLTVGPEYRGMIEKEALELTGIGNNFMIRHTETDKIPIGGEVEVDYLFHRLFSLIWVLLRETGRVS